MQLLRLSRCLRAAGLALVIVAVGTTQASAALVLSGNTHPFDTAPVVPPPVNGAVAFAVYQKVGGTYGDSTVDTFVATAGVGGAYAYVFDLINLGSSRIVNWNFGYDQTALVTSGTTAGTTFSTLAPANNLFIVPPSVGGPTDSAHLNPLPSGGGPTPAYASGGITPFVSVFSGGAYTALFIGTDLAPGAISSIVFYTSNIAPTNFTGTGIQSLPSSNAQGTIPLASPIPEPATVAMFATAIPFGILYLKRRKAASTV